MMSGCGSQKKGASAQTRRKECCRWRITERDCASKMVAFTPPPWRQRRRGSGFESGTVAGILEPGGLVVEGMVGCGGGVKARTCCAIMCSLLTREAEAGKSQGLAGFWR